MPSDPVNDLHEHSVNYARHDPQRLGEAPSPEMVPDWILGPGAILAEEMRARGSTITRIARSAPFSATLVTDVLAARTPVTPEFATWLERIWGTPASFWLRLEELWQTHRAQRPPAADDDA